jgi:SAM-dependent methyltransferase
LEDESLRGQPYDVVLAMNLLHLLDELPARLRRIHELVAPGGLFVSKTPCIGDLGFAFKLVIPLMRAAGLAPYVSFVTERSLGEDIAAAGFELLETGMYPRKSRSFFVVARKA